MWTRPWPPWWMAGGCALAAVGLAAEFVALSDARARGVRSFRAWAWEQEGSWLGCKPGVCGGEATSAADGCCYTRELWAEEGYLGLLFKRRRLRGNNKDGGGSSRRRGVEAIGGGSRGSSQGSQGSSAGSLYGIVPWFEGRASCSVKEGLRGIEAQRMGSLGGTMRSELRNPGLAAVLVAGMGIEEEQGDGKERGQVDRPREGKCLDDNGQWLNGLLDSGTNGQV